MVNECSITASTHAKPMHMHKKVLLISITMHVHTSTKDLLAMHMSLHIAIDTHT